MVECTALEMRRRWKPTVGSNPTLSATGLWANPDIQHCQSGLRAEAARYSDLLIMIIIAQFAQNYDRSRHKISHLGPAYKGLVA